MTKIVGLKEFRKNVEKYAHQAALGHSVIVVKRSHPIFRVEPPEEQWETILDFTKIRKRGVSIDDILKRLS